MTKRGGSPRTGEAPRGVLETLGPAVVAIRQQAERMQRTSEAGPRPRSSVAPLRVRTPEASGERVGSLGAARTVNVTPIEPSVDSERPSDTIHRHHLAVLTRTGAAAREG